MIDDLRTSEARPEDCDVIVVGSGAVGLTMAVRLARTGVRVLLLEAGPLIPNAESQAYFRAASASGYSLPGLHIGRFRAFGGTTNFWGGQMAPVDRHIFRERPWVCSEGWPISHEDIVPYYRSALSLLGMGSALTDAEVWSTLGIRPPDATADILPFFTRWTPVSNFARLFDKEIKERGNLRVCVNAPVTALHSSDGRTIRGVEIVAGDGRKILARGRRVVLACGTVEIVRLLLLSLANGNAPPWARNRWLGKGFMDHIDCYAGQIEPLDKKRFSDVFDNAFIEGVKYSPKLRLSPDAQRREQLLDVSAHFVFRSAFSESIDDIKIFLKGILRGRFDWQAIRDPLRTIAAVRFAFPMIARYLRYRRISNFSDAGIALRLTSEQSPEASSRITLRGDSDSLGMPNVDVNWKFRPSDIETLARFTEKVRDYLAGQGLALTTVDKKLLDRDPRFMDTIDDANHHMGGARMGSDPSRGVVDSEMKVFGTTNLYVCGAAVFPASGFANPTFTAIALGLKLAESIARVRV